MILSNYRLLYLHVPKTGGNSIQEMLLPHSDDYMILNGHQDGLDRFEIAGPVTPLKHADLQSYSQTLGNQLSRFRIAISVRHPFDRALSFYFSPHRWLRQTESGGWSLERPKFDIESFREMLTQERSICSFLKVDGKVKHPDIVVRFESLTTSFANMCSLVGLPITEPLAHRNRTAAADLKLNESDNVDARKLVETEYAEDFDLFGYDC